MNTKLVKLLLVLSLVMINVVPFECSHDFLCILYPVYAQTASPSSSLKEKLKALDAEIASKAAQLLTTINRRLQNKVYVGFIKSKSNTSLTLATKSGSFIVNINDYTTYEVGKKNSLASLAVDDYVAALGDIDDTDLLTAKKIIRYPAPTNTDKQIFGGIVTTTTAQAITVRNFDSSMKTIDLNTQTSYRFGDESADFSAIKVNKVVYVVGLTTENRLTARLVYIVPYTLTLPKSKIATSSASPSTSPKIKMR